jgi:uncharacterized protein (TIGR03083 family)
MNETVLDRNRSQTNDSLVAMLADLSFEGVSARILGCGNCLRAMMIHQQDVRRPLGLARTIPKERLRAVLGFVTQRAGSRNLGSASRARGLQLTATDIDWTLGSGPEVRGTGEAVLMAICGRRAALADLEGDGVRILAAHDVLRG